MQTSNPIRLDLTSDSCAVMLSCTPEQAEVLGGSVAGTSIEQIDDGFCYALVGEPWDDSRSDTENDDASQSYYDSVVAEVEGAGLEWSLS